MIAREICKTEERKADLKLSRVINIDKLKCEFLGFLQITAVADRLLDVIISLSGRYKILQ